MLRTRPIENNDIVAVINLMNEQHGNEETPGYAHNEAAWISNFMIMYHNPDALVIGVFDTDDNQLFGFMTADTFVSFYDNRLIADVKDCVTLGPKRGLIFNNLFEYFLEHYAGLGIMDWRFDSVKKDEVERTKLADFLEKRFGDRNDIEMFVSIRGTQV